MATHDDDKAALQKLRDLSKQLDVAHASQRAATSELTKAKQNTKHVKKAVVRVTKSVKAQSKQSTRRGTKTKR